MVTSIDIQLPDHGLVAQVGDVVVRNEALTFGGITGIQFVGRLVQDRLPADLRSALNEYREVVDEQVLSLVDEAVARVSQLGAVAWLNPEGQVRKVLDFQLYDGVVILVVALS